MRIKLTKIGNSWGVRLPKTVLTECGFDKEAELEVRHKMIMLSPVCAPRMNWSSEIENELVRRPALHKGEWQW